MPEPIRVTAILGSVTPPGRLRRALAEALERLDAPGAGEASGAGGAAGAGGAGSGAVVELIDLAEQRIAFADGRPPDALDDDTAAVVNAVARADAVVLATPVYRGSFTGALKNLLDHVPVPALQGTPVGLVAMGGSDHHYLGVERHLRDVLAFFGAHVLPTALYLSSRDFEDGVPRQGAAGQLDELVAATVALASVLRGTPALGPAPLAARF